MKRDITDTLDCEYRPEAALVVYKKYGHRDSEYSKELDTLSDQAQHTQL